MMMARPKGKPRAMRDIRQAVEMYIAGAKMTDIAAKFGVKQPTVSYWVRRHGVSLGSKRYVASIRKQGRRQDKVPNDRDKEIMFRAMMGVPASHLAAEKGITRARASFIVKTWLKRGYTTTSLFKPGQVVCDIPGSPSRFLVKEVNGTTGTVLQLVGLNEDETEFVKFDPPREIKDFRWFRCGNLCEIIDDTEAG